MEINLQVHFILTWLKRSRMFAHEFSLVSPDSCIWPLFFKLFYMLLWNYLVLIIFRFRTIEWVFSCRDILLNFVFNFILLMLFLWNLQKCAVYWIIHILIIFPLLIIVVIWYFFSFIYMLIIFGEIFGCLAEKWFCLICNLIHLF